MHLETLDNQSFILSCLKVQKKYFQENSVNTIVHNI